MKKLCLFLFIVSTFSVYGQENKLLDTISQLEDGEAQMKYVLNLTISDIPEDGFSKLLKIKLNSELNSLSNLFASYILSGDLNLSKKELSVIEGRVVYFANWLVENQKYVTVKNSGGFASTTGVNLDTIANKKVLVLLMGGDCTIDEYDNRSEYIYQIFNKKIKSLLKSKGD
tara:strand:- start:81407 stop:81922 length:516 start_codon:yes stop_codon:yes gene_type:complete